MTATWTRQEKEHAARRGRRLAVLRRQAGLSQQELADVVGITQASMSRIEAGKQGMAENVKVMMADALGLDPAEMWPYLTVQEATAE